MVTTNNIEIKTTTKEEMHTAIHQFVNALVAAPQYRSYEETSKNFQDDVEAKNALREYQSRAKDFQTKQMFNTITEEEQEELQRLWMKFMGFKSVQAYFAAQEGYQALCQECAQIISDKCGLDYATACGASCCG